jgi:tetratricopeptide (TPR) repeat protein
VNGPLCAVALTGLLACAPAADAPAPLAGSRDPREAAVWAAGGDRALARHRATGAPEALVSAEVAYRLALDLDPKSADALVGLARVHGADHAFEASRALAERALALDPEHAAAHGVLADAALELGQGDLAAEHVQAMLDLRPGLASYSRAALWLERAGEIERAEVLMRRALEAGGAGAEAAWCRAELARMLSRRGAFLEAEGWVAEALALAPDHPHVLAAAAELRAARGDRAGALALGERAVAGGAAPEALVALRLDAARAARR